MFKNAKILIPDTGPLITLEMINKLDLLLAPKMPVMIIDVVFEEVYDKNRPDNQIFLEFLVTDNNPLITHYKTDVGHTMHEKDWRSLPKREKSVFKHAGELAIRDFLQLQIEQKNNLFDYIVVTEDGRARREFELEFDFQDLSKKPLILSTGDFILLLEKHNLISSADKIFTEIEKASIEQNKPRHIFN